jgi:two-component system LytT family response regulator
MPPLKVLLADDEEEGRALLLHYLEGLGHPLTIREVADGIQTLQALKDFRPNIVFLDIKMPELSGLEVMQRKDPAFAMAVIFTTAYDEFALPAFDHEAVDYLLKPFGKERFEKAWSRALAYIDYNKTKQEGSWVTHITVRTGSKTDLVPVNEIMYFQAEGTYVKLVTANKTCLIPSAVYELESMLDSKCFCRVHRSVIVNAAFITSIQSLPNADSIIILKNGEELRGSRTYKETIKRIKALRKGR